MTARRSPASAARQHLDRTAGLARLRALEQGIGAGVLLGGRLHRGHHGAAGEIAFGDFLGGLPSLRELGHDRVDAALAGDAEAGAAIAAAAPHIARHVTALVLAYDPALVVIGGGLSRASARFVGVVEATLAAACVAPPRLAVSETGGESVALGAVRLALDAAGIPRVGGGA